MYNFFRNIDAISGKIQAVAIERSGIGSPRVRLGRSISSDQTVVCSKRQFVEDDGPQPKSKKLKESNIQAVAIERSKIGSPRVLLVRSIPAEKTVGCSKRQFVEDDEPQPKQKQRKVLTPKRNLRVRKVRFKTIFRMLNFSNENNCLYKICVKRNRFQFVNIFSLSIFRINQTIESERRY